MQPDEYKTLLQFASDLAREAGDILRRQILSTDNSYETKSNDTPITETDKRINALVIERVRAAYPEHGVLAEEGSHRAERPDLWVCDPIDGTSSFIIGELGSMFSLAFVRDGAPVVAVAYDPYCGRLFSAVKGQGAFCEGVVLRVSDKPIGKAVVVGPGNFKEADRVMRYLYDIKDRGAKVRLFGGAVNKGCLVALGRIEGMAFPGRSAHDMAAVKLIVEEAGGKVTDLTGQEQRYDGRIRGAIVSNGLIHDELLEAVQQYGMEEYLGY